MEAILGVEFGDNAAEEENLVPNWNQNDARSMYKNMLKRAAAEIAAHEAYMQRIAAQAVRLPVLKPRFNIFGIRSNINSMFWGYVYTKNASLYRAYIIRIYNFTSYLPDVLPEPKSLKFTSSSFDSTPF